MPEILEVPIEKIKVGKYEHRLETDDEELDGIAASIRKIGIVSPLVLDDDGGVFHLVFGHRRLQAAKRVGLQTVPCLFIDNTKIKPAEVTFAENFFRKDLSPVELACALKDCLNNQTMTVEELAAGFHRSEHWVRSMVAIYDWPKDVLEVIHESKLSVSAASNLALVTDESYRLFLIRNAVEQGATARTTASWLQAWRAMQPAEEAITSEPVVGLSPSVPLIPQAPCFLCSRVFDVNMMSHLPICGECIQTVRQAGSTGG